MVWKITGEFTNENIIDYIEKIKGRFKVIYKNETLYLMLKSYKDEVVYSDLNDLNSYETLEEMVERITQELKEKIFIPIGDFWIKNLTSQQWQREDDFVKTWIGEHISKLKQEKIEVEKQKELIQLMNDLDDWEKRLKKKKEEQENKEEENEKKTSQQQKLQRINDEVKVEAENEEDN